MPVVIRQSVLMSCAGLLGSVATAALAQDATRAPVSVFDTVTSTATRTERTLGDVPSTVTVIEAEEIERRNVNNTRDLIRYEPGISVSNNPTRAGRGSYVIRGIGENRVLVTIDGVRVPDAPNNSQPGTFSRDYVDLENLKRVEIVRGPASALYGSDAIGGVVAYVTKDPADYLRIVNKDWYVSGKAGFDSADRSFTETGTVAARSGPVDVLFLVTRRDGEETANSGDRSPNPQDYYVNNFLGKVIYHVSDVDRLRLTGEFTERDARTDIQSDLGPIQGPPGSAVTGSEGDDYTRRRRVTFDHSHDEAVGFVDRATWRLSYQEVDRIEHGEQQRFVAGTRRLRVTDQAFSQDIVSFDFQLESDAELGLQHRFTYGFDVDVINTTRPRDRTEFNLDTNTATKFIAGEFFPTKTFPDTETVLGGVYLQDEMLAFGNRLSVIPAVRVDYYRMTPSPDAEFLVNNTALTGQVSEVTETAISPKLGAVYKLTDIHSVFAQYAHGFRSPPYDDANIGFTNQAFGYQILPNPDLKPETSDGIEAGFRGAFRDGSSYQIATFYTLYQDFIEQRSIGTGPGGLLQFQAINLEEVEIYGAEAKGDWRITDTVSLLGAVAYARGTDKETGLPVDSVDPIKVVAGIRYEDPRNWGVELIGTAVGRKDRVSDETFFKVPGYGVLDLLGHYDIGTGFSINAGIFNLLDKKYFIAQDVTGVAATSPLLDLYTQPGTTFAVNAVLRW
jgi:hemoglobin/transferrin/lactoferrin receptor protein